MKSIPNILTGILLSLLLAGGIWLAVRPPQGQNVVLRPPSTHVLIQVNVVGAVVHPGMYTLDEKSRVADAVEAAGGLAAGADKDALNLAAPLRNDEKLDIPFVTVFVPEVEQAVEVVSEDTPAPVAGHPPENVNTPVPEPGIGTATPGAKTYSCADDVVGSGTFVWPAEDHFLTGNDFGPAHPGIDIAAGEGSPVYAADAGVVIGQGNDEAGYGNVIEIDHHNGYVTLYAHLSVIGVSMCQRVEAGEWIGAAGSTGNARGAHLHFGIAQDGHYINPWTILP